MTDFDSQLRESTNGSGVRVTTDGRLRATVAFHARPALSDQPALAGQARSPARPASAEAAFVAAVLALIVGGWLALLLAQLGILTRASLLLTFGGAAVAAATLALKAFAGRSATKLDNSQLTIHNSQFTIHNSQFLIRRTAWQDAALAGLLLVAAILYTPPADYAPAFLDAGWYTGAGALIARTGSLTTYPPVLQELPATDRQLFVRTFEDVRASLATFPDRRDLGFYDVAFAIDLARGGAVRPYHPPFTSVWIAALRLVGGAGLAQYAAPLFGLLFILGVYAAGSAIFGPNVGLVGALLTALSPPVVYYARAPFAELLAGSLVWAGVYGLTRYAATSRPVDVERPGAPAPLLAGLAFGAALLVKVESFLLLAPIALFWLIWLGRGWATRKELALFLGPFGFMLSHSVLLYSTTLRPYAVLNGHGLWSMLTTALSRPAAWTAMTLAYVAAISIVLAIRHRAPASPHLPNPKSQISNLKSQLPGLAIVAAAGAALLLTWPAARPETPSTWSSLSALSLFMTPLGLCLGIVGLSALVVDDLTRRTAFFVLLLGTAGLVTVVMPAISSDVSYLYTVRRQLPVVLPALWLLAAYVTLRWAGVPMGGGPIARRPAGLRRGLAGLILALIILNLLEVGLPLVRQQELAGSSRFVAGLAEVFAPEDIVLFEGVDRGAHVGRFAAPLWAGHAVSALVLSSTYPPQERLAGVLRRWLAHGRRVYLVSQSQPPPFEAPGFVWQLVDRRYWAGSTTAARMTFPPESWVLEVPFYIYEVQSSEQ